MSGAELFLEVAFFFMSNYDLGSLYVASQIPAIPKVGCHSWWFCGNDSTGCCYACPTIS